jgi:hypothetical protein
MEYYLVTPGLSEVGVRGTTETFAELFRDAMAYRWRKLVFREPDTQCSVKCEAGRSSIGKTIVTTSPLSDSRLDLPYTVSTTTATDTLRSTTICELRWRWASIYNGMMSIAKSYTVLVFKK